jgi:predicted PurR-regulated permease PerM
VPERVILVLLTPAIPTNKAVQPGVAVVAIASLTALLYYGRDFFVTLILAAVFALILDPIVQLVMKLRLPRALATFIVIGVAVTMVYLVGLMAWTQLLSIRADLPTYSSRVISKLRQSTWLYRRTCGSRRSRFSRSRRKP